MPQRTLVKLGGSLLASPRLRDVVREIPRLIPDRSLIFTVGGGKIVDTIRRFDEHHQLGEESSHWLALEAIGVNEQLLLTLFDDWQLVRSLSQLNMAENNARIPLICTNCFFKWGEREFGPRLPHTWNTTSDSIAAWFAEIVGAEQLILTKSVDWIPGLTWQAAHQHDLIDATFSEIVSPDLQVCWLNGCQDSLKLVSCTP